MNHRSDRRHPVPSILTTLAALMALLASLAAQGHSIGFAEDYALAADRAAAVATLIPGTEDWYYYHCRERLDARDFDTVRQVLPLWIRRHGRTQRVLEIEDREALLSFDQNPERTYAHLRQRLGLSWNYQRSIPGARSDLPTRLDDGLLSPSVLTKAALSRHRGTVNGFEDRALPALLTKDLDADQLHDLLGRLRRPDVDNLPTLIVRDLAHKHSQGFGSLRIHHELRRAQLDECADLKPDLLHEAKFVQAYLTRLQPREGGDLDSDAAARTAYLQSLWQFAQRLAPAHNSLKAHVLYHWLQHDLTRGTVDRERLLSYIRLPRNSGPIAREYNRRFAGNSELFVNRNSTYPSGLPAVGDDLPLLQACFENVFATEDNVAVYAEFLDERWLNAILAETRILRGEGDMERWYSLLDNPRRIEEIEKRVEITFPPTQPRFYAAGDAVRLEVDTKNVPTLLLKVFVIDSYRYHTELQKEVDATIELDGLVANHEETHDYTEPPQRRMRRTFDLPMLQAPGTYVVELVGNGISSRAVIHKGSLRHVERTSAAGHLFRVYDEAGTLQPVATLWFGGREYGADEDGDILVPFASSQGRKTAVIHVGNRSSLIHFVHQQELFELQGSAFIERESLVAGQTARMAIRPQLRIDGHPVSLQLLTEPVLLVTAIDVDGTPRTDEVRELKLVDAREFVHDISVPDRLQSLSVVLRGKVRNLNGDEIPLSTEATSFAINGIDLGATTVSALLVQDRQGYAIELRGKNGEVAVGRACTLSIKHRDYRQPVETALQSDAHGRIAVGSLRDIDHVTARIHGGPEATFHLGGATANLPLRLQGLAGQTLRIPYQGMAATVTRAEFSLLASDADAFSHLALADGFLELRDLPAGDYVLRLHERDATVPVSVTDGTANGRWIVGPHRILQASATEPLHLRSLAITGDELRIGLTNFTPDTRVHVISTRFQPTFDPFSHLRGSAGSAVASWTTSLAESSYHAGRKLGDEYRYVLERRFATKFAGNMLQRPSLLLNPWALERNSWSTAVGLGGGAGGRFGGRGGRSASKAGGEDARPDGSAAGAAGTFANLDYLPTAAATLFNLTPDEHGVITVAAADLADGQIVHVVAIDGDEALYDRVVRDERPLAPRNRALPAALAKDEHFVEHKRIEFVAAGGEAAIGDARSAEVEIFDSIASVFHLMSTVHTGPELAKFAFITTWPDLDAAEKRRLYSEHACHELHFFLYQKDRAFFDAVVRPFLGNKLNKTFLDRWLLGDDVRGYLEPWSFARLNLIEKILLAQRLDGAARGAVSRLIGEELELRPVDRDRLDMLFKTALAANELDDDKAVTARGLLALEAKNEDPSDAAKPTVTAGRPAGPATAGPGGPPPRSEARRRMRADEPAQAPAEAQAVDEVERESGSDDFFLGAKRKEMADKKDRAAELSQRGRVENLFRAVQPTKVLAESNYWRLPLENATPDYVAPNRFWRDYATASSSDPFVSAAFIEASTSLLEIMFAISVLDLPFEAGKHEVVADGDRRTLRAATPLLLVRKEVTSTTTADDEPPLLLGENFFRLDERYQFVNGEQREKLVTGEFLTAVAYGTQVVVSNPTGQRRSVDILLQIPAGALPVQRGFWTRSVAVELSPYETRSVEYAFYFPTAGDFEHYPAHAASKGKLVAAATGRSMHVVATPSQIDTRSWEHVSQQGSTAEVLAYLDNNNLLRLDLTKIAWRMKDREFFLAVTAKLRGRHVYDDVLWSHGLLHRHTDTTREYLRHADGLLQSCGAVLASELLTIDPIERGTFQHLELDPLVHARAHRLGSEHVIGNSDLAGQYAQLLDILGYHARLDSEDWLAVTYYLLLQDRIEEALQAAAKIIPTDLETRVQYDYLSTYLCFFTGDTQKARRLAETYRDHPVAHWQRRFRTVLTHLDEAEGRSDPTTGEPTGDVAARSPALEFVLDGQQARLAYENLDRCEVRYYELDVEFAFSARPFASTSGTAAAYVQPNLREERALPAAAAAIAFELPTQFRNKNVLVEVRAGGLLRSRTYFANTLDVRFLESHGQVAVTDPKRNRPLPKTYVKVFARLPNGQVRFHKDGYTDLRGRFDYASLSDDPNAGAERYAVLVLSDEFGAVIRDVAPPMQ
ncbi:MAG: hypothetical protein KDC98_17920 [Planctomycetes bacterium]|nr:hypothetical protein [Planctomycetota bacterium]